MAEAPLRMAERVARLSAWRVELPDFSSTWSDGVKAIHELPDGFVPIRDNIIDAYHPDDRPVLRAAVAECASSGKPFDLELRLITGTGRQIRARVIGEAVRDGTGRICRLEGAIQDITVRCGGAPRRNPGRSRTTGRPDARVVARPRRLGRVSGAAE